MLGPFVIERPVSRLDGRRFVRFYHRDLENKSGQHPNVTNNSDGSGRTNTYASVTGAGGKPSTWFPPEGLVELFFPKREFVWGTPLSQKSIVVQVGNGVFGPKSGRGILVCAPAFFQLRFRCGRPA